MVVEDLAVVEEVVEEEVIEVVVEDLVVAVVDLVVVEVVVVCLFPIRRKVCRRTNPFQGGGVRGGGVTGRGRGGDRGGRGRGAPRGGRGGKPGGRGGANVILEPHRHAGIFIAKGKDSMLVTKNLVPGESVYGEKRISIDGAEEGTKVEYRVWNPFRSKLAAGVLGGMSEIFIAPGKKVLYLGAASGTSVSHVADIVGPVCLFFSSLAQQDC